MVRSNCNGPLVVVLALVASACAQTPTPLPVNPTKPGERQITVQEVNRPPQLCRILRSWQMADGTQAYQVQALDTGELMTITENGNLATPPSPGRRYRAVATRIYHWGRSFRSPAGVPMPPGEVVVSTNRDYPAAVKLPPEDTRVNMPTPPLTVKAPVRTLPREHMESVIVQSPAPMPMPVAERIQPMQTQVTSPAPMMVTPPAPTQGNSTPYAASQPQKQVPTVMTSMQKQQRAVTTSLQKQQPADVVETPPSPYAGRQWPTAFSGQPPSDLGVGTTPVPPTMTAESKSMAVPVAMPVSREKENTTITSTVIGPCDACEPKRPFLRKLFKRDSKDPCCAEYWGKDPCACVPMTEKTGPVYVTTPAPRTSDTPPLTRPEPSKTLQQGTVVQTPTTLPPGVSLPVAQAPTTPSAPSNWRESWGKTAPSKPEEPIAKSPAPTESIANTTPYAPKKDNTVTTPPIPSAPKPLAQIASEPATTPAPRKDEKTPEGWRPFWRKTDQKKPEATARVEEKKCDIPPPPVVPTPPVVPPPPAIDKGPDPKPSAETAKGTTDTAQPEKRRPFWRREPKPKDEKAKKNDTAPPAPSSTAADWGSGSKKDDVATRSTKVQGSGIRAAPTYLPETPLPHASTEQSSDPLARPSEFAKHSPLDVKATTDVKVKTDVKAKTDIAKLTETKKSEPKEKEKPTEVAQASVKETPKNPATPASATENPENSLGSGSVVAAGSPQYIPVPVATVPNTMQQPVPPTPPMPNVPQPPNPNYGQYVNPNPLTVPPRGYRNAFTNPGPSNPVPAETIPPELSRNAFSQPEFEGQGTPPPAIPALLRNSPTISPGPIVAVPPGTPVGGIPMKNQGMMPMQGMPMQSMPPMQGVPPQQLPVPMQSNPLQQLPPMPVQPMGPTNQGAQPVPGMAWMPRQQFAPANYYHMPSASQVNFYSMPQQGMQVSYQQPQADPQSNVALLLQMLHESDYPSQREWAAEQLSNQSNRLSPAVVNGLATGAKEDPAPMVRVQCIRSLTRMQVQTLPVASLLQQMQQDADPRVRDAVNEAMTAMGMPTAKKTGDIQPTSVPAMPKE
jgi:hypothetical protein